MKRTLCLSVPYNTVQPEKIKEIKSCVDGIIIAAIAEDAEIPDVVTGVK